MHEIEFNLVLSEDLEDEQILGPGDDSSSPYAPNCFYLGIGDSPIAFPLRQVFTELGQPIQSKLYAGYELWLVPHRVSPMRRCGQAEVTSLGIEIEYLNGARTCSVVSLMPSPEFVTHGSLIVKGQIDVNGVVSPPLPTTARDTEPSLSMAGLNFGATGASDISFQFGTVVSTPRIAAVGIGARSCAWHFYKDRDPLFGQTVETWAVLALPKRQRELSYRLRCYYTLRTLFFSTRRETPWQEIHCILDRQGLADYEDA